MKTIRRGVFETNSSSEHSVTVGEEIFALPKAQYEQFKDGKAFFDKLNEQFITGKHCIRYIPMRSILVIYNMPSANRSAFKF